MRCTEFRDAVSRSITREMILKYPEDSYQRMIAGTVLSMAAERFQSLFDWLKENELVKILGIINGDEIDTDLLTRHALKSMPDSGIVIKKPIIGKIVLKKEDIQELSKYLEGSK